METEVLSHLLQQYRIQVCTVTNGPFSVILQPLHPIVVPDALVLHPVLISFISSKYCFDHFYHFEMLNNILTFPLFSFNINISLKYFRFAFSKSIPSISIKFYLIYSFQFLLEDLLFE